MSGVEETIRLWKGLLVPEVKFDCLYSKYPIVHNWRCAHRVLVVRELVFWRVTDLLEQAHLLHLKEHGLGTRILLRSVIETIVVLVYINQKMNAVVSGKLDFHEFSNISSKLLLGSKNGMTDLSAVNIMTVLKHCERKYRGISKIYNELCESAHPNFEGICQGYSEIVPEISITKFGNYWHEACGSKHDNLFYVLIKLFELENSEFPNLFKILERWIIDNNEKLQAKQTSTIKVSR